MVNKQKKNGITLIALVVTIVVLLILAGTSIAMLTGDNGIFNQAKEAKIKNEESAAREKLQLELADLITNKNIDSKYNEKGYIDNKLAEQGMTIIDDIVLVDGWQFKIDRSVLSIVDELGNIKEIANTNKNSLLKSFNCVAVQDEEISIFTNLTINSEVEDPNDIIGYAIFSNDKFKTFITEKTAVLKDMPDNIVEKITVLAVDKNYNTTSFTVYPERTKKKFVYLYGKQVENLTRTWLDTYDVTWNSDHIRYNVTTEKPGVGYRTTNKLDLLEYSKVCIYYDGYKNNSQADVGNFGYCPNVISAYNYPTKNASYVGSYIPYTKYNGVRTQKINTDAPSSYIYFELYGWVTINIYGIWLEE